MYQVFFKFNQVSLLDEKKLNPIKKIEKGIGEQILLMVAYIVCTHSSSPFNEEIQSKTSELHVIDMNAIAIKVQILSCPTTFFKLR